MHGLSYIANSCQGDIAGLHMMALDLPGQFVQTNGSRHGSFDYETWRVWLACDITIGLWWL